MTLSPLDEERLRKCEAGNPGCVGALMFFILTAVAVYSVARVVTIEAYLHARDGVSYQEWLDTHVNKR